MAILNTNAVLPKHSLGEIKLITHFKDLVDLLPAANTLIVLTFMVSTEHSIIYILHRCDEVSFKMLSDTWLFTKGR